MVSLIGGAVGGFAMKAFSLSMQNKQQQFEMLIKTIQAKDESADKAATRVPIDVGKGIRRLIVLTILFGVILAPFVLAVMGKPVIVEINTPVKEWIFGLFSTGGRVKFYELGSYLLIPELREALLLILGFYFGSGTVKK